MATSPHGSEGDGERDGVRGSKRLRSLAGRHAASAKLEALVEGFFACGCPSP
jgi:hypothetical protein